MLETIENVKNYGVIPIGAGPDEASARHPVILEKHGIRIALFATSMVIPVWEWAAEGDRPGLASRLQHVESQYRNGELEAVRAPPLITSWCTSTGGEERTTEPEDWVLRMEKVLRDAGADIIIGSHPPR